MRPLVIPDGCKHTGSHPRFGPNVATAGRLPTQFAAANCHRSAPDPCHPKVATAKHTPHRDAAGRMASSMAANVTGLHRQHPLS